MLYFNVLHADLVDVELVHDHHRALIPMVSHLAAGSVDLLLDLPLELISLLDGSILCYNLLVDLSLELGPVFLRFISETFKVFLQLLALSFPIVYNLEKLFLIIYCMSNLVFYFIDSSIDVVSH